MLKELHAMQQRSGNNHFGGPSTFDNSDDLIFSSFSVFGVDNFE